MILATVSQATIEVLAISNTDFAALGFIFDREETAFGFFDELFQFLVHFVFWFWFYGSGE